MGGTRDTPFHLDLPMRDCTLYLDAAAMIQGAAQPTTYLNG